MIEAIHECQTEHRIKATTLHVKGHQDSTTKVKDLTMPAQTNVKADALANQCCSKCQLSDLQVQPTASCSAMLHIRCQTLTTDCDRELVWTCMEPPCILHLQRKFGWNNTSMAASMSWDSLEQAMQRMGKPTLTAKICNDTLPTGSFLLARINGKDATMCPICGTDKTFEHVLQCNHPNRCKWKQQTVQKRMNVVAIDRCSCWL